MMSYQLIQEPVTKYKQAGICIGNPGNEIPGDFYKTDLILITKFPMTSMLTYCLGDRTTRRLSA
jgi:hypothetical protein